MKAIVKEETPLSVEGSFESVVNSYGTEKTGKQKKQRVSNTFRAMAELVAIVFLLRKLGVLTIVQAVLVSEIITCVASFLAGRLWERAFK